MVCGDDRNVPDATRWGERVSFAPTSPCARGANAKSAQVQGQGREVLKERFTERAKIDRFIDR